MNDLIHPVLFLFFANAVFGSQTDGMKWVSVIEGDTVFLPTCLSFDPHSKIRWTFGPEKRLIAPFKNDQNPDSSDGLFRDRLVMDPNTGSLTIRNIRTNHTGIYEVKITGTGGTTNNLFNVTVIGVFDPDANNITLLLANEGESVNLKTNVKVQKDNLMLWRFIKATKNCVYNPVHHVPCLSHSTTIARLDGETRDMSVDAGDYEMFKNRLKMDKLTGSLTVTDISPVHAGFYILQISNNTAIGYKRFNVTVTAVPKPDSCNVWKISFTVLLVGVMVLCLVCIFKNRHVLLQKMRFNCFNSKTQEEVSIEETGHLRTGHQ